MQRLRKLIEASTVDTNVVLAFLKDNPNPTDAQVHAWAEENKLDVPVVEQAIYEIATRFARFWFEGKSHESSFEPGQVDSTELEKGVQVETEHTSDPAIARKIALDHLAEFSGSRYYSALADMEEKLRASNYKV